MERFGDNGHKEKRQGNRHWSRRVSYKSNYEK